MPKAKIVVVPILNIEGLIGGPKNRILKMGVELEGGWAKLPKGTVPEPDGSVFRGNRDPKIHYGELPLGPMEPAGLSRYMKKYYPDILDRTCGMHVHMSFRTKRHYSWLMEETYQETLLTYLKRWAVKEGFAADHSIFERLEGKSVFCQKVFWPDKQYAYDRKDHNQVRDGHRYTSVHYCGRLNTIEIRVLPMMDKSEQAIRAVRHVVDVTNACLLRLACREPKVMGTVDMAGLEGHEDFIEVKI